MSSKKLEKNKKNILLAEGDRFISKVISNRLLRENFNVLLANDGQEAISRINDGDFDLILLDSMLKNKDGFEVLAEIRRDKKNKIPIVVLLNISKNSDIKKIKKLGISDYIVKSDLSMDMLVDKVKGAIR